MKVLINKTTIRIILLILNFVFLLLCIPVLYQEYQRNESVTDDGFRLLINLCWIITFFATVCILKQIFHKKLFPGKNDGLEKILIAFIQLTNSAYSIFLLIIGVGFTFIFIGSAYSNGLSTSSQDLFHLLLAFIIIATTIFIGYLIGKQTYFEDEQVSQESTSNRKSLEV